MEQKSAIESLNQNLNESYITSKSNVSVKMKIKSNGQHVSKTRSQAVKLDSQPLAVKTA